ncbi:lipase family protein [Chryseolinea sp. H1M3-3]|uniref:alpha/beta hydrolase family protein n=1 Tax=Chryseolinea sp. H1M3-3 TaxID=3034144 RepID=UPI0023ED1758|nr:lipase family protein [Chryseolinea sp. H1M3-3]
MKYFLIKNIRTLLIALTVIVSACNSDNDPQPSNEQFLVSSEFVYATTAAQLKLLIQFAGIDVNPNEFLYDIEIYKVTYTTSYDEGTITASGLIALPKTTQEVGMLSFHHGTLTNRADAPSNFSASDYNAISYAAMASVGFIGVIPDYLGFGSSSSILHPYYVEELTASSVIDMLKAATELARQKNIQFNGKLFLAGYSEGGYATMATHKAIEENPLDGFTLTASFPGAGAYDLKGMQQHIFNLQEYTDPHYLAYMARAYQLHYDRDNLLTDFFNEPYASRIPGLFDGQKGADAINSQLTPVIADLIQGDVLTGIDTDPQYQYLSDAFTENSLTDWKPEVKMFMYHGLSDATVPYQNSVDTFNKLISNGASTSDISLTPLEGTHSSAIEPYIADIIGKLLSLK